jgi:DNA helicase HerA-like ATPase
LKRLVVPPTPGSKVFLPYFEFLEDVFLRDAGGKRFERALHLGSLDVQAVSRNGNSKSLNFYLDSGGFRRQHFLIAGMTGAGKTHTAAVIVEELANKAALPVVVLDSFGEYAAVGFAGKRFEELVRAGVVSARDYPFEFGVSVFAFDPEAVKRRLEKSGVSVGKGGRFSVKEFSGKWREFPDEKAVRAVGEELRNAVASGQVLVLDGSGLGLEDRRKLFSCCVSALLGCRVDGSVEPFVFVVEEAEAVESELLERIASEGKKLGVLMCLLSQHPAGISGRVLSQIGCHLMGRMLDEGDVACLRSVAGDKSVLLSRLRTGEWIVNGISLGRPTKVLARERYSLSI